MVFGSYNTNFATRITKLCITKVTTNERFYVLYNPESYVQERSVKYKGEPGVDSEKPTVQYVHGTTETLAMELFFDTFSANTEVGGSTAERLEFADNVLLPSSRKMDVRKYTAKIYNLMSIDADTHVPPLLKIEWGSLQFTGHLVSCSQKFTKFSETGAPVRAVLSVRFVDYVEPGKSAQMSPNQSPDTAKYRVVHQGDSLWAFSAREYGDPAQWRVVARANGMANPRLLTSGETIRLPAL